MSKITEADIEYLRNIDTRPGPNAGQKIDPTKPGPDTPTSADVIEGMRGARIYLAARYSRSEELRGYRDELQALGFVVTSRWIDGGHELTREGSTQAHETERTRFAQEDKGDLEHADCVISFTEEPRKTTTRGGRHVEFGIALARGQRVIVVGHRENVFHCLPQVEFFATWPEARAALALPDSKPDNQGGA